MGTATTAGNENVRKRIVTATGRNHGTTLIPLKGRHFEAIVSLSDWSGGKDKQSYRKEQMQNFFLIRSSFKVTTTTLPVGTAP